jgi:hypothetical protein
MKAIRIASTGDGASYFEFGSLPEYVKIAATYFNIQSDIDEYQKRQHTAPRYQYVVTLSGVLRFTTSDKKSFVLQPGIILVAEDVLGEGHSWEIIEGDKWERIYIVPEQDANDCFEIDEKIS